jgi:hypothetical protein
MWDTKAIGRGLALPDLVLRSEWDRTRTVALAPLLEIAFPRAVERLDRTLRRLLPLFPSDPTLALRVEVFARGLRYEIDKVDGSVLISSSDNELERALHYGTREIPTVRPIHTLVGYLTESVALSTIVFTSKNRLL